VRCPNPKCSSTMSSCGSKGSRKLYRCMRCGMEKVEIVTNSDYAQRGSYIMNRSLDRLDKER
jgi:tRNA(Ile2) C34 agmatinyltransferase TiaS